jgi:hypothetical protein
VRDGNGVCCLLILLSEDAHFHRSISDRLLHPIPYILIDIFWESECQCYS